MRNRTILRTVAGATAAAALMIGATGASAQEGRDPDDGRKPADRETAEKLDAVILAERDRLDVGVALVHLQESRQFTALAGELAEAHPDTFASAVYAEDPGDASLVRFVGAPPKEALERVERSGLPVKVAGGAKYSEAQLQERAGKVHAHLQEAGWKEVVTATTPEDGLLVTVGGKGDPSLPRELAEGTRVTVHEGPVTTLEHTRGGARLFDDGVFECTSGFAVQAPNGTTGIATAAHCDGLNQYQQPTDGLVYGMTHQGQHNGFWGDVEWKTTPHVEPAEFFASQNNDVRPVNSVSGQLPVNVPSCVYGRASNDRECDDVFSNFVIATDTTGATNWFLMAMDGDNTIGGDSGGPWSFGTEADGIHKGDLFMSGATRNIWTRASLMPNAIGVSVRTQ